jgi:hypothetical protein
VYELTLDGLNLLHGEAERLHRMSHIAQRHLPRATS